MKSSTSLKTLVLTLVFVLTLGLHNVYGQFTLWDSHVTIENGIITDYLKAYSYNTQDILIPSVLQGQTVIGLADAPNAAGGIFYSEMLAKIRFPHTIQYLGDYSIYDSYVDYLVFTNCSTLNRIGKYAAYSTDLRTVDLENCTALQTIGQYAFANHQYSMTSINLSGCSALQNIEPYAFSNNPKVTSLNLTDCSSLEILNKYVFYDNNISTLNLTGCSSIIKFDENCFSRNVINILDLSVCPNLTDIAKEAFYSNQIPSIDLSVCPNIENIGDRAFYYNPISSLDLSSCNKLTAIGERAFSSNSLTGIDLSGCTSLTSIGTRAFSENSITSFALPTVSGMETFGWVDSEGKTYSGGDTVTNLAVSYWVPAPYTLQDDDVEVIDGTIVSCSYNFAFKNIIIPTTLDEQTITGIANAPNSATGIFSTKGIGTLQLPATIQKIGDYAFYNNLLTNVDLSNCVALTYIGKSTFEDNLLTSIDLSANINLIGIGDNAFYCYELASVNISNCTSLLSIGEAALYGDQVSGFTLPIVTNHSSLGWRDEDGAIHMGGETVTDLYTSYEVPVPYTLTSDDVVVENGIIISCSYDYFFKDIIIPENLDEQTVVGIVDANYQTGVFYQGELLTIQLPATMQKIGSYSFRESKLTRVDLSQCTSLDTIGEEAFNYCEIGSVDFSGCTELLYIGEGAFSGNQIYQIDLSACTKLEKIDYGAFYGNNMSSLSLHGCALLDTIGEQAFSDNDLTSIDFTGCVSLTSIGYAAFAYNDLTSLDFSVCPSLASIGNEAFYENYTIATLNLSNCTTLTSIGNDAFYENALTSVDLTGCTALTYIGDEAFDYNSLSEFVLPTVTAYEEYGWRDDNGNTYSGGETVTNLDAWYEVPIPYILTDDDVVVTGGVILSCSYNFERTDIIIPDTLDGQIVTGIVDAENSYTGVFYNKGISSVQLPSKLDTIGDYTFTDNSIFSLDFSICPLLTSIGKSAFEFSDDYDDNPITSLNFTGCNALTTIGDGAFSDNQITSLDLTDCTKLTYIGLVSFNSNPIASLDLSTCPALETIGDYAFQYSDITNLDLTGCSVLTTIGKYAFASNNLTSLDLNDCIALVSIGDYAFAWNSLSSLDITGCTSLTSIRNYAFASNSFPSGFTLPTPEAPGFYLDYWLAGTGVQHEGGDVATNTYTSYSAVFYKTILVAFNVSDGINPLQGVSINLDGFGEQITDNLGVAKFSANSSDSIYYSATFSGYITVEDSISAQDSFVTENVVMTLCNDSIKIVEIICEGEQVQFGESTYYSTGLYTQTYTNQLGCDSVIQLYLTVNPSYLIDTSINVCEGENVQIGDSTYSNTGIYETPLQTELGCDSIIRLNLTVHPSYDIKLFKTLCEGESFPIGDTAYSHTGIHISSLKSQYECDSTITLNLTVNPVDSVYINNSICQGEHVSIGDTSYYETGIHITNLTNQFLCDSIITLNLIVNPIDSITLNDTICFGDVVTIGDTSYNETGIHITNLTNQFLCDSVVTLNLTVRPINSIELIEVICEGEQFTVGVNNNYSQTGSYTNILENSYGCDSTVVLNLTVIPKEIILIETICEGESVAVGDSLYTQNGTYIDTLQNVLACDSIVTLNLTVLPEYTNLNQTLCMGDTAFIAHKFYTQTGVYTDTLFNQLGCDSIIVLDLIVNRTDSINLSEVICEGEAVLVGESSYTQTGNYTNNLINVFGCDSIVFLKLIVNPTHQSEIDDEICEGDTYLFNGIEYERQGTYIDTFQNQFGCDSIEILNLIVHPSDRILIKDTINGGDTYTFQGESYTSTGLYADTLENKQGCDSIITLLLFVNYEPVVFIPDTNFKTSLLADTLINSNKDDEIQISEAEKYSGSIIADNKQIESLIGIEAFVNIDTLNCSGNELDSLDLSANTRLAQVNCAQNTLTYFNTSGLNNLSHLNCANNQLTTLSPGTTETLQYFDCSGNNFVELDLSQNPNLLEFNCTNNQLSQLNLRNGNNSLMTVLATGNPNLTCVSIDDVNYANTNWKTLFDTGVIFSTDCMAPDIAVSNISFTPGEVFPGDTLQVSWQVINFGNANALGGWEERISLISGSGQQVFLNGNLKYNNDLVALDTIQRNAALVIPDLTYFSGTAYVQIELIPGSSIANIETNTANNTGISSNTLNIKELLTLSIGETTVPENYTGTVRCLVNRSGNSDQLLTVSLTTLSNDIIIPDFVVIQIGNNSQPFDLTIIDNQLFEGTRLAEITATATGYNNPSVNIEITDNDVPNLSIEIIPDTITEGNNVELVLSSNKTSDSIQVVGLSTNKNSQWEIPINVSIPATQNTVSIQISVNENSTPEFNESAIVYASSKGYNSARDTLFIIDDDIPDLQLTINPDTVSEAAGNDASWGTIIRVQDNSDAITFMLSSDLSSVVVPNMVHFFPGEMEKTFSIDITDNNIVDGFRSANITAAIYIPSCNCKSTVENGGVTSASIVIADNDGPSLSLACEPTTLAEGAVEAGTLTISRNTETSSAVLVTLSHNMPGEITIQDTVSIPAGNNSVNVPVLANNDGVDDGQQTVSLMASAENFSPGTTNIYTTDLNKPDLTIPEFTTNSDNVTIGETLELNATIQNTGLLNASAGLMVNLYLSSNNIFSSNDEVLATFQIDQSIPLGDSIDLWELITIPDIIGNFFLFLRVNPGELVPELLYTNNTSNGIPVTIKSDYTVHAMVAEETFTSAQPVTISGTANMSNGVPAANKAIEIYVITQGIRRTVEATSDVNGSFTTVFEPGLNEVGHYLVGACSPGENLWDVQDEFDFMGFAPTSSKWISWYVEKSTPLLDTLEIKNYSNATLSNLSFELLHVPNGLNLQVNPIQNLDGNSTGQFIFTITGTQVTEGFDYIQLPARIISDEGTSIEFNLFYFCQAKEGLLKTEPVNLETSFTKGNARYVEFYIYNIGAGNSGEINISLPDIDWMSLTSLPVIDNIGSGESSKVTLRLNSTVNTELNLPMTGKIAINATNCDGLELPYRIKCVSEETGSLVVDVVDEYTYSTAEAPHLANAQVKITNPYTGEIIGEGNTDTNGLIEFTDIPEGMYEMLVQAHQHDGYKKTILINPGMVTEELVFISFQAISYTWTVVPTEIEDEYKIELVMEYETNVPKPVVELEIPAVLPDIASDETYSFMATLTNHGLITAEDVDLSFPDDDADYEFIFQDKKYEIPAKQSIQIPVIMQFKNQLKSAGINSKVNAKNGTTAIELKCVDYSGYEYGWQCGPTKKYEMYKRPYKYSRCTEKTDDDDDDDDENGGDGDGDDDNQYDPDDVNNLTFNSPIPLPNIFGSGGLGVPVLDDIISAISEDSGSSGYDPNTPDFACEPCLVDLAKFVGGKIPVIGKVIQAYDCITAFTDVKPNDKKMFDCVLGLVPGSEYDPYKLVNDVINIATTCYGDPPGPPLKSASATAVKPTMPPIMRLAITDLYYVQAAEEIHLQWLNEFWAPIDWQSKLNLADLLTEISLFIEEHKQFQPSDIELIKQNLLLTDISAEDIDSFTARWNETMEAWDNNINTPNAQYPNVLDNNVVDECFSKADTITEYVLSRGVSSIGELFDVAVKSINDEVDANKNSVCASVKLSLTQKLVMTREAFRGTLSIYNGHETAAMEEFELNLEITNESGENCNDLFHIETEALAILTGINGTGVLDAQETGTATVLFIPEKEAAPTITQSYSFGGSISYIDPFTKTRVTKNLFPVTLEVHPSPDLYLHYFMQRDIYGDDPLTENIEEPIIPAELALMIENNGYGDAKNILIESAQPELIDNKKGLLIEFQLVASNLQGQPVNMGLINIDFGTVAAQSTKIGQWWFTSTLLGHFVNYEANLTHLDSRGNSSLSLISGATLHELIKSVSVYGGLDDNIPDFLVNEVQDKHELPDAIYLSQGNTVLDVYEAISGSFNQIVQPTSFTNQLTLLPRFMGWNYLKLDDPGKGQFEISSIIRNEDGQEIPLANAWLSHITMPDGEEHIYENKFHIVDNFESMNAQSYTIVWVPKNDNLPEVVEINGIPEQLTTTPLTDITVTFNKAIDPTSFTYEDLVLTMDNGANIADNSLIITPISETSYAINLANLTAADGQFTLNINTDAINDLAGNMGATDTLVSWLQSLSNPAIEEFIGVPITASKQTFDSIQLRFNIEIDASTLTPERFSLERDGTSLTPSLSITAADNSFTLFTLSGLETSLNADGIYKLWIDLAEIRSLTGQFGIDVQYIEWIIDITPPDLLAISEIEQNKMDEQHIAKLSLKFSEKLAELTIDKLELFKDNIKLDISHLSVSDLDNGLYYISDFGLSTYGEGSYTFKVKMDELIDEAGNSASGLSEYSWIVDRTPPPAVSNLAIIPDLGVSPSDQITTGDSVAISMIVNENNTKIEWYEVDGNTRTLLSEQSGISIGSLLIPAVFPGGGQINTEIICSDSLGNSVTSEFAFYIDKTELLATISGAPVSVVSSHPDSLLVEFSEEIKTEDFSNSNLSIINNGMPINSAVIQIVPLSNSIFKLTNIDSINLQNGKYELEIDISTVHKLLSGKLSNGKAAITWNIEIPNEAPVALAGNDTQVRQGQLCTLNGTGSYDPEGDSISFNWYNPLGITLINANSPSPSFIVPSEPLGTEYSFMLSTSDGQLSNTDKTQVAITALAIEVNIDSTICKYEQVILGSQTLTKTGIYSEIFAAADGTDSTVILSLTVNPLDSVAISETICEGETVMVGDSSYSETGVFVTMLENQFKCDSVVTLNLNVNSVDSVDITKIICLGEQTDVGDSSFNETGMFVTTLTNQFGCDSVVTLNLTVNPIDSVEIFKRICQGEHIDVGDSTYTETGMFVTTLSNQYGCDSVVTLDLTVNPIDSVEISKIICQGGQIDVGDSTYTETGIFLTTLSNQHGCDSVVTLDLFVNPVDSVEITETICKGDQINFGDSTYNETGIFVTTLSNQYDCDSVVTLDLSVNPVNSVEIAESICQGEQINIGGSTYNETGIFVTTLTNQIGCDSVVTLDLNVLPNVSTILNETICEDETFTMAGAIYKTTGTYTATLQSKTNCDSTVTLNLTVSQNTSSILNKSICEGEIFNFDGNTYSTSGTFSTVLTNSNGCDSLVTLNLTVNKPDATTINDTITEGERYQFNGNPITQAGSYTATHTNQFGCDSIVTLKLIIEDSTMPFVQNEIPDVQLYSGDSISVVLDLANNVFGGPENQTLTFYYMFNSGTQPDWITSTFNDSILILDVKPMLVDTGCYYVSIDATIPSGESVSDTFQICVLGNITGAEDFSFNNIEVNMYPNPSKGDVILTFDRQLESKVQLTVLDVTGKQVLIKTYHQPSDKIGFNLSREISGIYIVILEVEGHRVIKKLILSKE